MLRLACTLLCTASVVACFSTEEGEALKRDVVELKQRVSASSKSAEDGRRELQKIMEQATALLTRNSADVGAQVERIQTDNAKLAGRLDELNASLDKINQRVDQLQAKIEVTTETAEGNTATPQAPLDKDALYAQARAKFNGGDHTEARRLLRQFLGRFVGDSRAANAQQMLGDSYYLQQKFAAAIVEYRKILGQHKGSPVEGTALYKIGMSFYQLKFCGDARDFLQQFTRRFRRHQQAANARRVLKLIAKYKRNPEFCRS